MIFDRELPKKSELEITEIGSSERDPQVKYLMIRHPQWGVQVKVAAKVPPSGDQSRVLVFADASVTVPGDAKLSMIEGMNKMIFKVQEPTIVVPELILAESASGEAQDGQQPLIADKRNYSGFTFGYNRPRAVKCFEQLLCVFAAFSDEPNRSITFVADGKDVAGSAIAASVVAGDRVGRCYVTTEGSRFADVTAYSDRNFVPGAARYFDLPGLMSLRAPHPLTVIDDSGEDLDLVKRVYLATGATDKLEIK